MLISDNKVYEVRAKPANGKQLFVCQHLRVAKEAPKQAYTSKISTYKRTSI